MADIMNIINSAVMHLSSCGNYVSSCNEVYTDPLERGIRTRNTISLTGPLPSIRCIAPRMRGRVALHAAPSFSDMAKKNSKQSSRTCLAANVRAARSLFDLSQEDLGLQCGLKRTYVGALERKEINPGIDNLDKVALGLGVSPHILLLSPELAYAEIYAAFKLRPTVA